ncbi:hypothetical protein ACOMHN_062487 [Nucella lapillus]
MEKHKTRKVLNLKQKIQLIKEVEGNPQKTRKIIADKYGIPHSTLSTIIKEKQKYERQYKGGEHNGSRIRCRGPQHQDVDDALLRWFKQARSEGFTVNGPMLKTKADELSQILGILNWRCSEGWIHRWKKRHGIQFRSSMGQPSENSPKDVLPEPLDAADDGPQEPVEEQSGDRQTKDALMQTLGWYKPQDIFSLGVSALFWRLLPTKMLYFKGNRCPSGEKSKERLTLMVCCNMDGSEKMPLCVVGKYKNPPSLKGIKTHPVQYEASPKAWMTARVFLQWLQSFDAKMAKHNRKVLLVVGSCPTQDVPSLKATEILFDPHNLQSNQHPCYQGIIDSLKADYRKTKVLKLMAHTSAGGTVKGYKFSLLDAVCTLKSAWDRVAPATIRLCLTKAFSKRGESCSSTEVSSNEHKTKVQEPCLSRFFEEWNVSPLEYFSVDNDATTTGPVRSAPCTAESTQSTSIASSQTSLRKEMSSDDEEEDECRQMQEQVSGKTALDCLQTIQTFCLQSGCSSPVMNSFNTFAQALNRHLACANQQTKITHFFTPARLKGKGERGKGCGAPISSGGENRIKVDKLLEELSAEDVKPAGTWTESDGTGNTDNFIVRVENADNDDDDYAFYGDGDYDCEME